MYNVHTYIEFHFKITFKKSVYFACETLFSLKRFQSGNGCGGVLPQLLHFLKMLYDLDNNGLLKLYPFKKIMINKSGNCYKA